jgi:glycosyltransferase involved in cell wall biosynthesis/SAM-dependent methyltransferase
MNQGDSTLYDKHRDLRPPCREPQHSFEFLCTVADEIIRALHPSRVLDAGCATGLLVEAFWERGVYCEGIDVSEHALSRVRSDLRPYCSLRSIAEPAAGRFDLVTCIDVVEYLPPELTRVAVANLCAASDVVLFSSPLCDCGEPGCMNHRPTTYWLQLFSELDFHPDLRFDAAFVAPEAMLLRKGRPTEDDAQRLLSELMRYKRAVQRTTCLEAKYKEAQMLAQNNREERDRLAATVALAESHLAAARADLGRVTALERELVISAKLREEIAARLNSRESEIQQLQQRFDKLRVESDNNQASLAAQLAASERERLRVQATLDAVLASRAWRLAEKCRRPLRKIRSDWPRLHNVLRFVARNAAPRTWRLHAPLAEVSSLRERPSPAVPDSAPTLEPTRHGSIDASTSASEGLNHVDNSNNDVSAEQPARDNPVSPPRQPTEEEMIVSWFDCTEEQFRNIREQNASLQGFRNIRRLLWFLPYFENPFYGGVFTILRFAEYWHRTKGVESAFAICANTDRDAMLGRLRAIYPQLEDSNLFILENQAQTAELPSVDASICTLWTTTYFAAHHRRPARRFYLIQDFEPAFYRAGSASAVVESTYHMGLYGIANTISLKKTYESQYGGKAAYFKPCVDVSLFYPPSARHSRNPDRPFKVFLYGRPGQPRNAFELIIAAMRLVKKALGDHVHIYSAGSDWSVADYSLQGIIENLGLLSYEDTARLYRESDLGVVMMLTRHPSYIPFELMASGCLVVTNVNPFTSWLLKDGVNCLLSRTTPSSIAENVKRGLLDEALRAQITQTALSLIRSEYSNWQAQMDDIYAYLCDPDSYLLVRNDNIIHQQEPLPVRTHAAAI